MIDVRKLRLLVALERLGTITAVAQEVHLTAPGVSMQIAALEKELGVQLTQRQGRRVTLTAAGLLLAAHGQALLDRLSLVEVALEALRAGTAGRYTLTAFPSAARTFVADACRRILSDENFMLELRITTSEPDTALDALTSGNADLAVIHSYSNVPREIPRGIAVRSLGSEPVWLAIQRGRIETNQPANLTDFARDAWIAPAHDVSCFSMMDRACGLAGFRPHIVAESTDFAVQLELVAAGLGVALVPALAVGSVPAEVDLLELASPVRRGIYLAARTPVFADPGIETIARILGDTATVHLVPPMTAGDASRRTPE